MANPILHIKDSYYFEVPRALYSPHYDSLEDVPQFLRELHKDDFHISGENLTEVPEGHEKEVLHAFEEGMAGKVLIPQPFGELKSLYSKKSGFAISKFMILELVVAAILVFVFTRLSKRIVSDRPVKGRLANMFEAFLDFIRLEVVKPSMGHGYERFLPLLWTVFFFILGCNLLGMVPFMGTATATIEVTAALALGIIITTFYAGFSTFGPKWAWSGFVPHMELDWWLAWLKIPIFLIEVLGMFIKHAVLAIRLLANMAAGHLVLLGILSLVVHAAETNSASYGITAFAGVLGAGLLSCLELLVAFLQAYVFTLLSALFIGSAMHEH